MKPQFTLRTLLLLVFGTLIILVLGFEFLKSLGISKRDHTLTALTSVKCTVHYFAMENDTLPKHVGELEDFCSNPMFLRDGWGRPVVYEVSSDGKTLKIGSFGRDGKPGGTKEDTDLFETYRCYDSNDQFFVADSDWLVASQVFNQADEAQ